jgi:hypothetical protein
MKGGNSLRDGGVDGNNINIDVNKTDGRGNLVDFVLLSISTSAGLLCTRQ